LNVHCKINAKKQKTKKSKKDILEMTTQPQPLNQNDDEEEEKEENLSELLEELGLEDEEAEEIGDVMEDEE
jgi:hypothetical protein